MSSPNVAALGAMLVDPDNADLICATLLQNGYRKQDVQDGLHDVYVKALAAFRREKAPAAPADLEEMKAYCAKIAVRVAIDAKRKRAARQRDLVAGCDPDEIEPLGQRAVQRDPVDAGRQLEVLAQLFREGRMPEGGVDILEAVACNCPQEEIAQELGIEPNLVKWRLHVMRKVFRRRMEKLGLASNVTPLPELVSAPGAIDVLRTVA